MDFVYTTTIVKPIEWRENHTGTTISGTDNCDICGLMQFNDILNVFFASPVVVALIVAVFLDNTLTRHVSKRDRGMLWTRKFRHFGNDPRNYEFYRLPVGLHKFFPPT